MQYGNVFFIPAIQRLTVIFKMENFKQVEGLKEYVASLERELEAKSREQQALYRALDGAEKELRILDQLYQTKRQLSSEVAFLRNELNSLPIDRAQLNEVINELVWSRSEITRLSILVQQQLCQSQFLPMEQSMPSLVVTSGQLQASPEEQNCKWSKMVEQFKLKMKDRQKQNEELQEKLQALSGNYIQVEHAVMEKDQVISQLREEMEEMRESLEKLQLQLSQKNIMINCLQSQLEEAQAIHRSEAQHENELEVNLGSISKIDLICQANKLVQRVNFLERQNRRESYPYNQKISKLQAQLSSLKDEFLALSQDLQL